MKTIDDRRKYGKMRIGIIGLGGVGGYFGGHLAEKYYNSEEVEIIFIARPSTEKVIKEKGLKLITPQYEKTVYPGLVTSNTNNVGHLDFLIAAIKSYDLEESLISLKNSISNKTIILPLLNGVDAKERINKIYQATEILDGCVYIVSRLIEPGVVKETGNIHSLYFGSKSAPADKLKQLEKIFLEANIECYLSDNIEEAIWEKFIFISSIASLTSYLDLTIGEILDNENHKRTLKELITEIKSITDIKNIQLSDNIIEKTIEKMKKLPFETTSSMHSDFKKGGRTEYRSLTEYVTLLGEELNIPTPQFDKIVTEFKEREKKSYIS